MADVRVNPYLGFKEVVAMVNWNCGCGFTTHSADEACQHCLDTGHKLTVRGSMGQFEHDALPKGGQVMAALGFKVVKRE